MMFIKAKNTIGQKLKFGFTVRRRSIFVILCGFMVILSFSCSQVTDEMKPEIGEFLKNGNAYLDTGDYDQALIEFTKAIELDPHSALAYRSRGNAYSYLSEFDKAIDDFTQAIGLNPDEALLAIVYHNRGTIYLYKSDYEQAIYDLTQSIELNPDFRVLRASAFISRGQAYLGIDEYEKAIDDYKQAITLEAELDPATLADGYFGLCIAYSSLSEYREAIGALDKIIDLKPNDEYLAYAYYDRGLMHDYLSDYDKAIADYTESIDLDANIDIRIWAYNNRGWVYREKDEPDLAIADANRALALNPDEDTASPIYDTRGQAYYIQGEYAKAIDDLTKSIDTFSGENVFLAVRYCTRGSAYVGMEKFSLGIADFDKAIELSQGYMKKNKRSLNMTTTNMSMADLYEILAGYISDHINKIDPEAKNLLATGGDTVIDQGTLLAIQGRVQSWGTIVSTTTGIIRAIGDGLKNVTQNIR
jgi:tetratricopeptide (TPR) repeat protein